MRNQNLTPLDRGGIQGTLCVPPQAVSTSGMFTRRGPGQAGSGQNTALSSVRMARMGGWVAERPAAPATPAPAGPGRPEPAESAGLARGHVSAARRRDFFAGGSPVPMVYEVTRWFQPQGRQTSTT